MALKWWTVRGPNLRALREATGLTLEKIAAETGVSVRTIATLERGGARAQTSTIESLAKRLAVPVDSLGAREWSRTREPETPIADDKLPPRSKLDALARTAKRTARRDPPPVDDRTVLTPRVLQDIFTAFAAHHGKRYVLRGRIDTQRGLGFVESKLLGCPIGEAARFMVIDVIAPDTPLTVTVYTRDATATLALQSQLDTAREMSLTLRLARVQYAEEGATVVGITPTTDWIPEHARAPLKGFAWFGSEGFRPWVLVVEGFQLVDNG